ncbi:hypothetical protein B0H10DRAFT_2226555 [Mycena sp. CBHHK59/15]|nr:hypothetical protein B0H10DRAFT_2229205 [Mycena sp. CBHHK59/15]KAJ6608733.1 hypothetical protein B0H10DRAFT_2226555 [Mycena sp. CBHHK59/15]
MLALNLAHKGRETRGVLAKSTKQTVGSLTWSIVRFFLASSLLFLLPPLAYLLAVTTTAWFSAAPSQGINTYLISSIDPLTLAGATYAYWTPACAYFDSSDGVIMIFVNVASADTVALAVTPATSISDIREVHAMSPVTYQVHFS